MRTRFGLWILRAGTLALGAALSAMPAGAVDSAASTTADRVFLHGVVLTLDAHDTVAEALAVRGNRIVAVGTDAAIARLAGPHTQVVDLAGRAVTPGLIDTHAHFVDVAADNALHALTLDDVRSVDELIARVRARAAVAAPGEWITGSGWDEGKLREHRYPRAAELDTASGDHPVFLGHTSGHYAVVNSRALAAAGLSDASQDPPAGTLDRDAEGHLSGVLKESAQELVSSRLPLPGLEQRKAALRALLAQIPREGLTSIKEMVNPPAWQAYLELARDRQLDVRVCTLFYAGTTLASAKAALAEIRAARRAARALPDRLRACGAKIFMDGSAMARTAWSNSPWYKDATTIDAGNSGYPSVDPGVFRKQVQLFQNAGIQVGTHAIGERAIDWVVDTYADALAAHPVRGLRHTIIHAYLPTPHAIDVMADLERRFDAAYPEVQPGFLWWLGAGYVDSFGPARLPGTMPLHSYASHGVRFAGGSDYSVIPYPPRYGLWAAVEREVQDGTRPFGTAEAVDIHTILAAYTRDAAPLLGLDRYVGQLTAGRRADLVVWRENPYTVAPSRLRDLHAVMTLIDGRVVFDADEH